MEANFENIEAVFLKMADEGWDTEGPLKWGFFFYSDCEDKLKGIFSELVDREYTIDYIRETENSEWVLSVGKTEVLASDKLHRRNMAFNELSSAYDSYYDGWDVAKCA